MLKFPIELVTYDCIKKMIIEELEIYCLFNAGKNYCVEQQVHFNFEVFN